MPNIYILIIGYCCIAVLVILRASYARKNPIARRGLDVVISSAVCVFTVIVGGMRDLHVGTDTYEYARLFQEAQDSEFISFLSRPDNNIAFSVFTYVISYLSSYRIYFIVISLLFIGIHIWAYKKMMPQCFYLALFCLISTFFYYSMTVNVIRNSLALALCAAAIGCDTNNRKYTAIAIFLVAVLLHNTSVLVALTYYASSRLYSLKISLTVLLISVLLTIGGFDIKYLIDNHSSALSLLNLPYKTSSFINNYSYIEYNTSFRWDFLVFNLSAAAGAIILYKRTNMRDAANRRLLNTYILASSVFVCTFSLPFSDRWGLLSWVLIPLILIYPLTKERLIRNQEVYAALICILVGLMNIPMITNICG